MSSPSSPRRTSNRHMNDPLGGIYEPRSVSSDVTERVGDYLLGAEIGKGSFATVYKGYKGVREWNAIAICLRRAAKHPQ